MRATHFSLLLWLSGSSFLVAQSTTPAYPFRDPSLDLEKRVNNVLSLMTVEEKIDSLSTSGVVAPRLGIKGTPIGEALSGVALGGPIYSMLSVIPGPTHGQPSPVTPTTQFPQGVGLGRTWDRALMHEAGAVIGSEARYIHENGLNAKSYLILLTPNADLARDPRWGRDQESYGEDGYFNGAMAAPFIKGIQGDDPKYWQAASLVKHFLANSNENNRYGSSSDFDERLLREYYSVPFRQAFVAGGARSFMASYNAWNHVPMTVNPILKELAVKEWGVDGIISTDAGSLQNLVQAHKAYPDLEHATAAAMKAGIGMFLTIGEDWKTAVKSALADHLISEKDLDASLRGSLRVAFRLGLLDPEGSTPFAKMKGMPNPVESAEHKAVALKVARESVVLLKNEPDAKGKALLPLDKEKMHSIAVVGPLADVVLPDFYGGQSPYTVSVLEAIRKKVGPGVAVIANQDQTVDGDAAAAKKADVAVVVVGNNPTCGRTPQELLGSLMSSIAPKASCAIAGEGMESSDRSSLTLEQEELVKAVYAVNPRTVVVLVASAPFAIEWTEEHVPAIVHTSHNGQDEGTSIADVVFGDYNPAGRLVQTWVKSIDQLPPMTDYNIRHGRTYMYLKSEPLYPFGFGLSYTTFKYGAVDCGGGTMAKAGSVTCTVDVTNSGAIDGDEVVEMYVRHLGSKVERSIKELKGFERVTIPHGETRKVTFVLKASELAYWDEGTDGWRVEAEPVEVQVGGSSADVKAKATVRVE